MKPREGVYYAAWMAGIIVTVPICRAIGLHHILGLVIGVGVGFCLGIGAEKLYDHFFPKDTARKTLNKQPPVNESYEQGCPNLKCNWYGDTRSRLNCPQCNERLHNPYRSPTG